MVSYAKERAKLLPVNFEENLDRLFQNLFTAPELVSQILAEIISALENIIYR